MSVDAIASAIRDVNDFPKEGIVFKDISPVLQDPDLFRQTIDLMCEKYMDNCPDVIVAIDARGFIFGSAMAYKMGCGLSLVRKKGKLPWQCMEISYDLEYGSAEMEVHVDAVKEGDRVLLVDDLLATGGTAAAAAQLVDSLGGDVIALAFLVELEFLNGRDRLDGYHVDALIGFN